MAVSETRITVTSSGYQCWRRVQLSESLRLDFIASEIMEVRGDILTDTRSSISMRSKRVVFLESNVSGQPRLAMEADESIHVPVLVLLIPPKCQGLLPVGKTGMKYVNGKREVVFRCPTPVYTDGYKVKFGEKCACMVLASVLLESESQDEILLEISFTGSPGGRKAGCFSPIDKRPTRKRFSLRSASCPIRPSDQENPRTEGFPDKITSCFVRGPKPWP